MEVARSTQRKSKRRDEELSPVMFDLNTLNLYCEYVLSENNLIRGSNLTAMKKLFDLIDINKYKGDIERSKRIEFIKRGLDAKVSKKIRNKTLIIQYINGGPLDNQLLDISNFKELSNDDVEWINVSVSETIKYLFMYNYIDKLLDLCQRFKSENYARRSDIVDEFENLVDDIKKEFRRVKNESYAETEFSLMDGIFEEVIGDIYAREINPSRRLVTGMQGLNLMLGGGLESGRVYMLFGTAAAGKSFTMLDMMIQIKKYNTQYICHDKTKRPCVVLLTMENSLHETITRLFGMISGGKMDQYSLDDVINKLRSEGNLVLNDDNPIDLYIKYKPNLSVDTSYMYTLYEDLEELGYEPIAIFQDHIKRIRPAISNHDMRLDLGEIVNEFKAFAIEKDIPVISDSHLNRDAAKILDEAARANKQDLARLLGRSNVSESMLMIDNCDVGMIITKDYDKHGNQYMGFVQVKTRTECGINYFVQPFVQNNNIKLVEDINDQIPAYKTSLYDENSIQLQNNNRSDYSSNIRRIDADDDDDLFSSSVMNNNTNNINYNDPLGMIDMPPSGFTVIGGPSNPIFPTIPIDNIMNSNPDMPLEELIALQLRINPNAHSAIYMFDGQGGTFDCLGRPCLPPQNISQIIQ